ncbi:Piso0_005091 [Millerozyma farinosa CBS 7064]|uniref:Piso0_005091 protein n=1 Tax=Pichia sorbitophila (strain ATCC MYA-4447 / BCRC 22081 / CBS 7064 / NBRC 10061 / NRRL Y-12695) TaxID=559304 RepID=G8Y191_PICSO|nr:Piso0_005091 [Millerozyma farinosa CBS 7064]
MASIFDSTVPERRTVLVIADSDKEVDFLYSSDVEVIVVSSITRVGDYIRDLLKRESSAPVTVISITSDIEALVRQCKLIGKYSPHVHDGMLTSNYAKRQSSYTTSTKNDSSSVDQNESLTSKGVSNYMLGVELVVVLDAQTIHSDFLSHNSVMMQQVARFISLKHCATYTCVSNSEGIFMDCNSVLSFLEKTGVAGFSTNSLPEASPNYEQVDVDPLQTYRINSMIPSGWDTRQRIMLLASVADNEDSDVDLIRTDDDFLKVDEWYNKLLEAPIFHDNSTPEQFVLPFDNPSTDKQAEVNLEDSTSSKLDLQSVLKRIYSTCI